LRGMGQQGPANNPRGGNARIDGSALHHQFRP
jgi:hypothetical protein